MDIEHLIDTLFNNEIKPVNSIGVSFEGMDNTREMFETFLTIFTEGMKIHFGQNGTVNLNNLSHEQFSKIVKYFASIGVILHYHKFHVLQVEALENENYDDNPNISFKYDVKGDNISGENLEKYYPEKPTKDLLIPYKQVNSTNLEDYKFQIRVVDSIFVLYFKLM